MVEVRSRLLVRRACRASHSVSLLGGNQPAKLSRSIERIGGNKRLPYLLKSSAVGTLQMTANLSFTFLPGVLMLQIQKLLVLFITELATV